MKMRRSLAGAAVGIGLMIAAACIAPSASAENSCGGLAMINYSADHAYVKNVGGCTSVAVRHHYFAAGTWFWTAMTYKYLPSAGIGYVSPNGAEVNSGQACAAVYYPSWTCAYGSWEPVTATSYSSF